MKINHLKVNHLVNPLGNDINHPTVSYVVEDTTGVKQTMGQFVLPHQKFF